MRGSRRAAGADTPKPLQTRFLTNSGTEAIQGTLRLARRYTGRSKLISTERGFHGRTFRLRAHRRVVRCNPWNDCAACRAPHWFREPAYNPASAWKDGFRAGYSCR